MTKRLELTGHRFGKLKVIDYWGRNIKGQSIWICTCSCKRACFIDGKELRSGTTTNCAECRKQDQRKAG